MRFVGWCLVAGGGTTRVVLELSYCFTPLQNTAICEQLVAVDRYNTLLSCAHAFQHTCETSDTREIVHVLFSAYERKEITGSSQISLASSWEQVVNKMSRHNFSQSRVESNFEHVGSKIGFVFIFIVIIVIITICWHRFWYASGTDLKDSGVGSFRAFVGSFRAFVLQML